MQRGTVNDASEPVTVYAILVGDAQSLTALMVNSEEKEENNLSPFEMDAIKTVGVKTSLLLDLQYRSPHLQIPIFDSEKQAFYQAKKAFPAHALTICELQIPADKYRPVASVFNNKDITTLTPAMLSYVTLVTGYKSTDKEYHLGNSFTVQKSTDHKIEFIPEGHKIIHVKPK
jgi:hypothetical protein